MLHDESAFKTPEGLTLFSQSWRPAGESKAAIIIVHGYAEHSSRYAHVAKYLTDSKFAVYAFDLRGHGRSDGRRALVDSFSQYISDLEVYLAQIKEKEIGKPLFLLGHSMGGTIATLFAIAGRPDVNGIILSGPLLKLSKKLSSFFILMVKVTGTISPGREVLKRINPSLLSRDPREAAKYDHDPLVYREPLRARQAREINYAVGLIQKRMEEISLPLFILHGTDDRIVDVEGARSLYERAASRDKTLKLYDGFYHEVLNEIGKERVLEDIGSWLNNRI